MAHSSLGSPPPGPVTTGKGLLGRLADFPTNFLKEEGPL